jgi:hypothetical protein
MGRRVWTGLLAIALTAPACGGADVPAHNGYRSPKARPWRSPTVLQLDDSLETEVDDSVSYPKQQRARWYAVDLPGSGELEVSVTIAELSDDRDVDVAMEVLDEGYRVIAKADREEEDSGEDQKIRKVPGLAAGRYYIHVYAPRRLDAADYTLQAVFRPRVSNAPSDFPARVAFISALPDVPLQDDAPPAAPVVKKCKGSKCKKRVPKVVDDSQPPPKSVRARIAGIVESGKGVQIRINQGTNQGIEVGWKGTVVSRDGKPIPGGSFEISKVSAGESFGTVRASADSITSAKYVRLKPP